jgi:hypothetical protein
MGKPGGEGAEQTRGSNESPPDETAGDRSERDESGFRLAVGDLVAGDAQEVVLFNDSAVREVILETDEAPLADGEVDDHVTADGVDVSGFRFLRFPRGLTLYHDPDTRVRVEPSAD